MPSRFISTLVCTLCLLGSSSAAQQTPLEFRQAQARWLSQQFQRPMEASQILVSPESTTLEGCTITRARLAPTGATALSLRCSGSRLPHLLLLNIPSEDARPLLASFSASPSSDSSHAASPNALLPAHHTAATSLNIVRAGASLTADWRTDFIHAQLPAIALDSGAAGAEIRVRLPQTNRIVRARILSANAVTIIMAGA